MRTSAPPSSATGFKTPLRVQLTYQHRLSRSFNPIARRHRRRGFEGNRAIHGREFCGKHSNRLVQPMRVWQLGTDEHFKLSGVEVCRSKALGQRAHDDGALTSTEAASHLSCKSHERVSQWKRPQMVQRRWNLCAGMQVFVQIVYLKHFSGLHENGISNALPSEGAHLAAGQLSVEAIGRWTQPFLPQLVSGEGSIGSAVVKDQCRHLHILQLAGHAQ